jgi:hypothetical protein
MFIVVVPSWQDPEEAKKLKRYSKTMVWLVEKEHKMVGK